MYSHSIHLSSRDLIRIIGGSVSSVPIWQLWFNVSSSPENGYSFGICKQYITIVIVMKAGLIGVDTSGRGWFCRFYMTSTAFGLPIFFLCVSMHCADCVLGDINCSGSHSACPFLSYLNIEFFLKHCALLRTIPPIPLGKGTVTICPLYQAYAEYHPRKILCVYDAIEFSLPSLSINPCYMCSVFSFSMVLGGKWRERYYQRAWRRIQRFLEQWQFVIVETGRFYAN